MPSDCWGDQAPSPFAHHGSVEGECATKDDTIASRGREAGKALVVKQRRWKESDRAYDSSSSGNKLATALLCRMVLTALQ